MKLRLATLAVIGLFGVAQACADELPRVAKQPTAHERHSAVGAASWYGKDFHGHRTADGEIFDMRALSAASRTLPLPCYARVTNLGNGRSVVVRVNDRGPFFGRRIVDVSAQAANLLDFNRRGVTKVRVDYLGAAPPARSDEQATLLASLRTGDTPPLAFAPTRAVAPAALALASAVTPAVAPAAPDGGETIVARVAPRSEADKPRSPYGELVAIPLEERSAAARSPYGELVVAPFLSQVFAQAAPALRSEAP